MRRSTMRRFLATTWFLCSAFSAAGLAQGQYVPTPENIASRQWFQDARFGLFIHWGIYSELGAGEWVMNNRGIPAAQYERLSTFFNPIKFDASVWSRSPRRRG